MENEDGIDLNLLKSEEEFDSQWISLCSPPLFSPSLSAFCSQDLPRFSFGQEEEQSSSSSISRMSNHNLEVANPASINPNTSSTSMALRSHSSRPRRNPTQTPGPGRSETIPPPYPWATNRRATLYSLDYLIANGLNLIEGDVQCRRCDHNARISFQLSSKFQEIRIFILSNLHSMHDRAPPEWMNPVFSACQECGQPNCMKPVISDKKRSINWLFMFLGQTLGCCTLEQLKYFCKHTQNHRTGAKNRVLYLSYMSICKQLDPNFCNF